MISSFHTSIVSQTEPLIIPVIMRMFFLQNVGDVRFSFSSAAVQSL